MDYRKFLNEPTYRYLGELYTHEVRNSYMYQYISSYLSNIGLDNLSLFFKYRAREEMHHSEMVRDFCDNLNIMLPMNGVIKPFEQELRGVADFARMAYDVEMETNELWERFYDMCYADGNSRIFIVLAEEFLSEQVEESTWANQLMDYAENQGEDKSAWQRFDNGFDPESYGVGIGGDDDDD